MSQPLDNGPKPSASRPEVQPAATHHSPAGGYSRQTTYYSPPPSASEPTSESSAKGIGKARLIGIGVAAAAGLAIVAAIGFATRRAPPPPAASVPPAVVPAAANVKTLTVSAADRDDKATEQLKGALAMKSASAAVMAATVKDLKADNAPALMRIADTAPQMASDLQSDRRRLYRVYLLDFLDQDGDRVELFLDGISYGDIDLKNEGASFLLPVASGAPLQVKMVATADGGGGVTVAFISSLGEARTSVMQVGEFEQWQVLVQ